MQRLINEILERAKADRQRIVLPEGTEERTLKAANQILTDGIADLILLGNPAEINACATEWGLGNIPRRPLSIRKTIRDWKNTHSCCSSYVRKRHDH